MRTWALAFVLLIALLGVGAGEVSGGLKAQAQGEGPRLTHGAAAGDVTPRTAVLWARADGPAAIRFELSLDPEFREVFRSVTVPVEAETDFIAQAAIADLEPDTVYFYRARAEQGGNASEWTEGRFRTAPPEDENAPVTLLWSGDLGGQGRCRRPEYEVFKAMAEVPADLFLLLGDSVYADEVCQSPPNLPGSAFSAPFLRTLEAYRAKHRYNRADLPYQALLAQLGLVVVWDDHEVENDFIGTEVDPELLALGRRALFEYYPIATSRDDPTRLYRAFRWGRHLELIVLDTRQYRVLNETMLGEEQLRWLLERIERSDATWLVIASSVTLSVARSCPRCDGWADGLPGGPTKFERELQVVLEALRAAGRRNVVFLTGDVHFPRVLNYDPDGDGTPDFREFTAGPLSAFPGVLSPPDPTFRPEVLYSDGGFFNFGVLSVDAEGALTVELRDETGRVRFQQTFEPLE